MVIDFSTCCCQKQVQLIKAVLLGSADFLEGAVFVFDPADKFGISLYLVVIVHHDLLLELNIFRVAEVIAHCQKYGKEERKSDGFPVSEQEAFSLFHPLLFFHHGSDFGKRHTQQTEDYCCLAAENSQRHGYKYRLDRFIIIGPFE